MRRGGYVLASLPFVDASFQEYAVSVPGALKAVVWESRMFGFILRNKVNFTYG